MRHLAVLATVSLAGCMIGDQSSQDDAVAGDGLGDLDFEGTDDERGDVGTLSARVCAQGAVTKGIDVSYYQGVIDWNRVKSDGVEYAFIRVSDGEVFRDPKFTANWANARSAGVIRGAYQFFRPAQNIANQAQMMISAVGRHQAGDLPPVIDVENTGGLSGAQVAAKVRQWVDLVEAGVGVKPIVYTGKYFWRDQVGGSAAFESHPLWIAQYTTKCPDLPSPWTKWTFWQHTDRGRVAGISGNVDMNKFNGSVEDLRAFADGGVPTGTAAPAIAMPFFWQRTGASYQFVGETDRAPDVVRVEFRVDDYLIGAANATSGQAVIDYVFNAKRNARVIEARGLDANGATIAVGNGLIDSTDTPEAYVDQYGDSTYEIGTEDSTAASVEVFANDFPLVDSVSGLQKSTRGIVRFEFTNPGVRELRIVTRNASNQIIKSVVRTFLVR